MSLEIDHVFSFCDPALVEVPLLEAQGFRVHQGRAHPGQGTANRCVVFEENYFELIYLTSEGEARTNALRVDRRANWRTTHASPFGIALRGQLSERDRGQFWAHRPAYAPGVTIWIHEANETNPVLPLLFVMEFPQSPPLEELKPRVRFREQDFLRHQLRTTRIESIIAFGPGAQWPLAERVEGVRFEPAPKPHLHLHLDGHEKRNFAISPLCSFAIT